jgi:flagellar assembly factor FliW
VEIITTRFGQAEAIQVAADQVYLFPTGLVGFPGLRSYARIADASGFGWLQSLDDINHCFVIANPAAFFPDYGFDIGDADVQALKLTDAGDAEAVVIVRLGDTPEQSTANLAAPIVLNRESRLGRQIVIADGRWPIRSPLLGAVPAGA